MNARNSDIGFGLLACVAYQGCDAGYPVHWCPHPDAHTIPSFAAAAIATFFNQF